MRQPPQRNRRSGLYIGRVFGIRFYLDFSWFFIAALVVYALSASFFPLVYPGLSQGGYLAMGVSAAALFFLSILLHELGHSVVSQRCGIPVPRITLLFIGGIAEISREPDDAKSELKIAVAGPAVSLILVGLYWLISRGLEAAGLPAGALIFSWLATVNLALVIFNAIPGYPLDGGRVLRALIWAWTGNLRKATLITSTIGVGFSWFLMIGGVLLILQRQFNGFVLILIGLFLKNAAESGYNQAVFRHVLNGIRVRDIMTKNPSWIPAHVPINLAVDSYFLADHHIAFPVCDEDGSFRGLLRLEFLRELPREKWPYTSAGDLAAASTGLKIGEEELAEKAMRRLLTPGEGRLAVTNAENRLVGMVTRSDILQFIRIHTELEPF